MSITVYSKKHCPQCLATYRQFDKLGIEYQIVDVEADVVAFAQLIAEGFKAMPVVKTEADIWTGFRPDKIKSLATDLVAA